MVYIAYNTINIWWNKMKHEISLSPIAVKQMEEILSSGKELHAYAGNGKLTIWEESKRKRYEVRVSERRNSGE